MRTIHRWELERIIQEDKSINFLAFVQTPWHALGVDAFIKSKEDEGTHLKGNVCILSHTQAGFILDVNSFSFNSPDIEVSKYTNGVNENLVTKLRNNLTVSRELKKLHSNGSDFYILATVYPKYQWHAFVSQNCPGKRPISVLVDEGLGMYMRSTRDWIMESWFSKDRFYKKVKYTYEFCYGRPKKEKQLKSKNELIFYGLFYTKDMTINTKVAEYYKKVLLDEKKLVRHEVPSYYENSVVINTQPYYDEGQLESEADTSLIKQICRACSQEGYTVVLKPHPREKSLDRYSCIEDCIMDTDYMLSQESIIANLKAKPKLVIGLCSTTLVSLKIFYGIQTLSMLHCIAEKGIGKKMKNDLRKFEKVFGNIVECPLTMDDFNRILKRMD